MHTLATGFYLMDATGSIRCQDVMKGRGEERALVTIPLRFRTLQNAKSANTLTNGECAILCVTSGEFNWGE